jgi:Mg-chelatase subunit ChlD
MRRSVLALLLSLALAGDLSRPAPVAAQSAAPLDSYRLIDTWGDWAWEPAAGRFVRSGDISSAPDGRRYILDQALGRIHQLDAQGLPIALLPIYEQPSAAYAFRLDAAMDGSYWVLGSIFNPLGPASSQLDHFAADGLRLGGFVSRLPLGDLAVDSAGRLFATVMTERARVLILDASGTQIDEFGLDLLDQPVALDVAADGTVYVVNRVSDSGPGSGSEPTPGPAPTREPSQGSRPSRHDRPSRPTQEDAGAVEGVYVFTPRDHALETVHPISAAGDIAVGPAGVFASRELEIFALGEPAPLYSLGYPSLGSSLQSGPAMHLDVPAGGGLAASLWHCYFQGLVAIDAPAARPASARYLGAIDRPLLAGPAYPRRIAAGEGELSLLLGRFGMKGQADERSYHPAEISLESEPQGLQRWQLDADPGGALLGQRGVCAGHPNAPSTLWARDVAADGPAIYTLDARFIRKRQAEHFPDWSFWSGSEGEADAPHFLTALDAEDGRLAYVDQGAGRIGILDAAGQHMAAFYFPRLDLDGKGGSQALLPADVALSSDRIFLASAGSPRLAVLGLDGSDRGSIRLHDIPSRIASGDDGAVFVLGRGGQIYRYDAGGSLGARWALPESAPEPLDIAVDGQGRVYVSFVLTDYMRMPQGHAELAFLRAGTWVFAPELAALPPAPAPPSACQPAPYKQAQPARLPLGDPVDIRLRIDGQCPGRGEALSLALVVDSSRSMSWDGALERAQEAAVELLSRLDPASARVSLVSFADSAAVLRPLDADLPAAAAAVLALEAGGDTRLSEAIALAARSLEGETGRRAILFLTDGGFKDDPRTAAAEAEAAGIELHAWIFRTDDFPGLTLVSNGLTTGQRDRVLLDPDGPARAAWLDASSNWRRPAHLLDTATLIDRIPANMRYLQGSAEPPARFDIAANTLTWDLAAVPPLRGITLSYQVRPLEPGIWPTNVEAAADYVDGWGESGRLVFPIPVVEVIAPPSQPGRIYLPFLSRGACFEPALPLDLVLLMDVSQSMDEAASGGGTKLDAARLAAGAFVDLLSLGRDQVAVVGFHDTAARALGLSSDRARIRTALNDLTTSPGTRIDRGLAAARSVLYSEGRPGARPAVIQLTDGLQAGPSIDVTIEAERLRAMGSLLYTIGLGDQIDRELLSSIANPPGAFYASPITEDLESVYRAILERVACDAGAGDGIGDRGQPDGRKKQDLTGAKVSIDSSVR